MSPDFNGDGIVDVAIADAEATVDGLARAGRVHVVYGGGKGSVTITQPQLGTGAAPEAGDRFGFALAVYDANADGCTDLAASAPYESVGTVADAGTVWVVLGSVSGIGATAATAYTQASLNLGSTEAGDVFGYSLAAGATTAAKPFLVIGAPGEDIGSGTDTKVDAGAVHYVRSDVQIGFDQSTTGVDGEAEANDRYGYAVAASASHVAASNPGEDEFGGGVQVLTHTVSGSALTSVGNVTQEGDAQSGSLEPNDWFGRSISMTAYIPPGQSAAGSLLAVGGPGEALTNNTEPTAGRMVAVSAAGSLTELTEVQQGSDGVDGATEPGDYFAWSVCLTNRAPGSAATWDTVLLGVGVPGEDTTVGTDTGAVQAFSMVGAPGDHDVAVETATMTSTGWAYRPGALLGAFLGCSATSLYVADPRGMSPAVYAIPWTLITAGTGAVTVYRPGTDGLPTTGVVAFGAAIA